ncbi:hypothetical protein OG298_45325 (plasmid) [Streptomyces sp. NBC_01005]|uniref:hypothetical protein n=1 Tax=Streptomyces sp. NBC_01005 TaxID=2903715 RepID=UPI002F90B3F7|nr:hypothetical protein OG298_45325 [Streptomyces sp. NBC_01005]
MSARENLIGYDALVALPNEPAFEKCEQLADAYRAEVLHEAARLLEAAGYSDDAVNWLDTYADWEPAGLNELSERLGPPAEHTAGLTELEAMRRQHPAPCRVPDSPDCTCPAETDAATQ